MGLLKYALHLMIYVNSETILNNDRFFSPYMRKVIHIIEKKHLTITYRIDYDYIKILENQLSIFIVQHHFQQKSGSRNSKVL